MPSNTAAGGADAIYPGTCRGGAGAPAGSVADFQDWCLRTYGDSGKTKTVTRRKYNRILQTLLQSTDSRGGAAARDQDGGNGNAKFKFWVKSKGFQVGGQDWTGTGTGTGDRAVLFVPIKAACMEGASNRDSSLKRVAVVEDFFDIIYSMHVEIGTEPGKTPKHAGQKKTYKAVSMQHGDPALTD